MSRYLIAFSLAAALVGCRNSNDAASAHADIEKTRANANQEEINAQNKADKKIANAHEDAAKAQGEADQQMADTEKQAREKIRDLHAQAGEPVSVTGTVNSVGDNDLHLTTSAGKDLTLKLSENAREEPGASTLKEGDQVRASYDVVNGDNLVRTLHVLHKAAPDGGQ